MKKELQLKVGQNHTIHNLIEKLSFLGYRQKHNMSDIKSGDFMLLGGTAYIHPVDKIYVCQIDFFGNEIDQIYIKNESKKEKIGEVFLLANLIVLEDRSLIKPQQYVVHEDSGIGIFQRLMAKKVAGEVINYIVLEYLNGDNLFVPFQQLSKLSKYIGVGKRKPRLSKLGSTTWKRTYKKTYENIIQMARELLQIYAKREIIKRSPLVLNQEWSKNIEKTFGFAETSDQTRAIEDVYKDLEKDIPMDRLVCGDVGFGKTEVAIRTATQMVANGYQVAILVPTTILAEQHEVTFERRFAVLPVRVARISRFVKEAEKSQIYEKLKNGQIDIIIGTHSLLSDDLKFKNLGILIIDEEQKFGVKDKEKLKKLKGEIDVLTLTATPIPRTLFMSISGIRDISLINSIPFGRQSIDTKVIKFDEGEVISYIRRELDRKGQVYYLHNRVATIQSIKRNLEKVFPNKIIEVAHGQMGEEKLANTMRDFTDGKIDILVCSTIIENGLDLPNVNTLIVDESDRFGLSQLYQIRGRIGRSLRQAYSLFTYRTKTMTLNAVRRLEALVENTELGTGYNIALDDLEIRGGGNILGREQHGNMEAVGLVLYSKMLKLAVEKLKKR